MNRAEACAIARASQDVVDVAPLRDAFLRSGMSARDVAAILGWTRTNANRYWRGRVPDSGQVLRVLGLKTYSPGGGYPPRRRESIRPAMALKLAEAIGVDPVDVGL